MKPPPSLEFFVFLFGGKILTHIFFPKWEILLLIFGVTKTPEVAQVALVSLAAPKGNLFQPWVF